MHILRKAGTAFIITFSVALGAIAAAASGDLIYRIGGSAEEITGSQAACYADCAIADGTWTGARADMRKACAWRQAPGEFRALVIGVKRAAAASVPFGDTPIPVEGVVP